MNWNDEDIREMVLEQFKSYTKKFEESILSIRHNKEYKCSGLLEQITKK